MQKVLATGAAVLVTLACPNAVFAHHSGSMYQSVPVWIQGAVVGFEPSNPHTIIVLEEQREAGQIRRWRIEGPGQAQLTRMNITTEIPNIGDVIEVCAFPYKTAAELALLFPEADFSVRRLAEASDGTTPQAIAGHVLMMPDGERRFWEPHGVISECMRRADDERESWISFINANARARQGWCEQRRYAIVQSNESLRGFVEEIDGLIDNPC